MAGDNLTTWRKATYSHANSNCVEVGADRRAVGVRDTMQSRGGPTLQFSAEAWQAFIDTQKRRPQAIYHDQLALLHIVLDTGLAVI
jgi:hypothetical protein